jgi:phosphotransferase system enzyme I (PtsI)
MLTFRGIPVSPGVAIGTAVVLDTEGYRIAPRHIEPSQVESELQRLRESLSMAALEARVSQHAIADKLGSHVADILGAHAQLLEGTVITRDAIPLIRDQFYAAEYAVSKSISKLAQALASVDSSRFASRTSDLLDVEKRVLGQLLGQRRQQLSHLEKPSILFAHDLTPSETASLDSKRIIAFATEAGGKTSHTAIMAGALEIPAIVGLGTFLAEVSEGVLVIVDGHDGTLIIDPDEATLERYEAERRSFQTLELQLDELRDLPAITKDGVPITLLGNIEFPNEIEHCRQRGAQGVGLYRTEFLYLGRDSDPTEDEHYNAYVDVINALPEGQPVVIRTLDLGADKFASPSWTNEPERNPVLGQRSIRLCLRNLPLFKTQLRAILRASAKGTVRLMFPMISTLRELRECKLHLREVQEDLLCDGIGFDRQLQIGTMIEVPSAALISDMLAREVDFFSIGTNDLVQYTIAADRTNELVADLYNPADPAVLRLIRTVIDAASRANIQANICGEMSGDPAFTLLLIGMGMRQLSVTPHNIPEIKRVIRAVTWTAATHVAEETFRFDNARDVTNYLRDQTRRLLHGSAD